MTKQTTPDRLARGPLLAAASAALLFLAGCADMGGIDSKATLRAPESVGLSADAASNVKVSDIAQNRVDARWWTQFGDAQLNGLVDAALQGNPSLKVAQARVAKSLANVDVAGAAGKPSLGAGLTANRQLYSENFIYPPPLGGAVENDATLQLSGSWELDFFGKNRTALEASVGASNAAIADAAAAQVMLTTRIASTYIGWARLNGMQDVARRTLAQREETLKLVQDRVAAGLDTNLELRQSQAGLPEARLRLEELTEQVALTQHALDALVGQPNFAQTLKPPQLAQIKPAGVLANIPADLLGHRADVVAARWRVEAATKDAANAKTLFYPNVNLVAFAGFQSLGFDQLLKSSSQQWGIGPAITLPIFEGGKLRANLRGKQADLDAAIESYNGTVLDAVRDVADQVSSSQSIQRQLVQQHAGEVAAEGAYDIAVQRYRAGLGTFLNVLAAETTVLVQRRQGVDLAARVLDNQVALAHALGGGYQDPDTQTASR